MNSIKPVPVILLALVVMGSSCRPDTGRETMNPNIIFIVCDDLNDAIAPLGGHPQTLTPNLDRLAEAGVSFINAQVNAPICGPSRASFLTGLYPHTTGYFGYNFLNDHWRNNPVLGRSVTMMEHFRVHGYHVMGTGKIFHNNQEDWTVWDEFGIMPSWGPWPWDGTPDDRYEFDSLSPWRNSVVHPDMPESFGIGPQFGSIDNVPDVPADPLNDVPGYKGWRLFFKPFRYNSPADRDLMPDELNARWAGEMLKREFDKPFLMCVGINRPHAPMFAPQEFFDLYSMDTIQLARALENDDEDCSRLIVETGGFSTGFTGRDRYNLYLKEGMLKEWTQAYLANVSFLDAQIGKILDALSDSPYAENTFVFFTSDHGYHMGEKDWIFKNSVWEESARVPLLVRGPGIPAGMQCDQPVSLVDLFPTFIDLAGIAGDPHGGTHGLPLDGHSMSALMEGPENGRWNGPDAALTTVASNEPLALGQPGQAEHQFHSLRTRRYRYILCPNGEEELYDHEVDPYEWHNLAGDPAYISIKADLRRQLKDILWD